MIIVVVKYNTLFYSAVVYPFFLSTVLASTKSFLLLWDLLSNDSSRLTAARHNMHRSSRGIHWSSTLHQILKRGHLVSNYLVKLYPRQLISRKLILMISSRKYDMQPFKLLHSIYNIREPVPSTLQTASRRKIQIR